MKIRDTSGMTMFIFGMIALLLGLIGLIRPEYLLSILGFEAINRAQRAAGDFTLVFMTASSMASFNMGIYYILAALNDIKIFYRWTVPFRMASFLVFTTVVIGGIAPKGFLGVGIWELLGALSTGISLYLDDHKTKEPLPIAAQSPAKSKSKR